MIKICKKCDAKFETNVIFNGKKKHLRSRSVCLNCLPYTEYDKKTLICLNCHIPFPTQSDGKSFYNRKYCLLCVPFGKKHNHFHFNPVDKTTPRECSLCGKIYLYSRSKGHRARSCNSCKTTANNKIKKQRCLEYKGGKCVCCGYNNYYGSLDFHHLDPSKKEFQIGRNWSRKWEVLKLELDKCVILCRNCHGEVHAGLKKVPNESLPERERD